MSSDTNRPPALDPQTLSPRSAAAEKNGSAAETEAGDRESLVYEPVPPRKTVMVTVSYRLRGRGQPLPYPLTEEDSE